MRRPLDCPCGDGFGVGRQHRASRPCQRFQLSRKNNENLVLNAPQTTAMRRAVYPTKFAELSFLLLLGAVVVARVVDRAQ